METDPLQNNELNRPKQFDSWPLVDKKTYLINREKGMSPEEALVFYEKERDDTRSSSIKDLMEKMGIKNNTTIRQGEEIKLDSEPAGEELISNLEITSEPTPEVPIEPEIEIESENAEKIISDPVQLENVLVPEKSQEEQLKELEILRNDLAKAELSVDKILEVRDRGEYSDEEYSRRNEEYLRLKNEYNTKKQNIAGILKDNDLIFEKLVKTETQAYRDAYKEERGETFADKAKESFKKALTSKAVSWYGRQNKWARLGVTTLLATGIGYGVGTVAAVGAVGYAGARLVRGAASFGGVAIGKAIGEKKKSWSIEELEKKEKEVMG